MTHPYQLLVGGRGYGKNAAARRWAQIEHSRTVMDQLQRDARRIMDALKRQDRVAGILAHSPRTAPPAIPSIGKVHWMCIRPRAVPLPVYAVGTNGWFHEQAALVLAGKQTIQDVVDKVEASR